MDSSLSCASIPSGKQPLLQPGAASLCPDRPKLLDSTVHRRISREMLPKHVRAHCHAGEAARLKKRPRKWAGEGFRSTSNRVDGRFFVSAQNDMLCNHHLRKLPVKCRYKLSS